MRTGTARRCRRWRQAASASQRIHPASAASAIANSLASGTCTPSERPVSSECIAIRFPAAARVPRSTAGEKLLQRTAQVQNVVDDDERNIAGLGDLGELAVGVAVVADDQELGARRGQLDELIGERIAALLTAYVQHDDQNALILGSVEQLPGARQLVLEGDTGFAEALEACADAEEQRLHVVELVDLGACIVFEWNAGSADHELDLEGIEALAARGDQHRRARLRPL